MFDDKRGVSNVLGFVLMFSLVVTTFAIYQADVIPHQNRAVEQEHAERMELEASALQSTLDTVASEGGTESTTLDLSPDYATRAIGLNGPTPQGTVRTTAAHQVELFGINSTETVYWNGSKRRYTTRLLEIDVDYTYRQRAPSYALENGMVVKRYESGGARVATGSIVSNGTIDLTLVSGSVATSGESVSLAVREVSTSTESITVTSTRPPGEPNGGPTYVEVPTTLSLATWEDRIASNANVTDVRVYCVGTSKNKTSNCPDAPLGTARLYLAEGTYDLHITKVSLGDASSPTATYLTSPDRHLPVPGIGQSQTLRAVVRDRYGNPVPNAQVNLSVVSGEGSLPTTQVTTDEEGVATFGFESSGGNYAKIQASIRGGGAPYETLSFELGRSDVLVMSSSNQRFTGLTVDGLWIKETSAISTADCFTFLWESCSRARATEASFMYIVRDRTSGDILDTYQIFVSLRDEDGDRTFTSTSIDVDSLDEDDRMHDDKIRVEIYDNYTLENELFEADLDEAALTAIEDPNRRANILANDSYSHDADHGTDLEPHFSTALFNETDGQTLPAIPTNDSDRTVEIVVNEVRGRLVVETR